MKIFNKRRLPDNLRILGSHIFKNSFNPFSFKSRLNSPSKVSDFSFGRQILKKLNLLQKILMLFYLEKKVRFFMNLFFIIKKENS